MTTEISQISNLHEPDVTLDGKSWDDPQIRLWWSKQELIFSRYREYWKPLVTNAKTMFNYLHGNIFDSRTRQIYENVQKKICIEPKILKKRMNSAVGHIMERKRGGRIVTEGGSTVYRVHLANLVMKYIEESTKEQYTINNMLFNGCVCGYPQVVFFDLAQTAYGDPIGGLNVTQWPWDAVVFSPFERPDGEDMNDVIRMSRKTRQELIDETPEREKHIVEFYDKLKREGDGYSKLLDTTYGLTIEDARYLNYDILTGVTNHRIDGRLLTMDRQFVLKMNLPIAVSRTVQSNETLDYQIIPPAWDKARKAMWIAQHPEYQVVERPIKVVWNTRWTKEGLALKNELGWFQETTDRGEPIIPIAAFTPQIIDSMPTGPGPDDKHLVLLKAISETEFLHDIRTGANDVFAYKKGKISNATDLPTELSIGNGIIQIDDETMEPPEKFATFLKRTPNQTYGEYSERIDQQLDQTDGVNPALMGAHVPDQAAKSKNLEIGGALVSYSIVAENYNKTIERIKNLECMMVPYCFTEEQILQVYDDDVQEDKDLILNEKQYDNNGSFLGINPANDLSSAKWRYRLIPGDDSPTAKQAEMNEMLIFWNTTAPSLIDADETLSLLSSVLQSMNNKTAKEIGRVIQEKAEVEAQALSQQQMMETMALLKEKSAKADAEMIKAKRSGFSFSITPEDLAMYPGVYPMLVQSGYINPQQNNTFQNPQAVPQQVPQGAA